jgi:hypothetical protein
MGVTHPLRGLPRTATLGLGEARIAKLNGKSPALRATQGEHSTNADRDVSAGPQRGTMPKRRGESAESFARCQGRIIRCFAPHPSRMLGAARLAFAGVARVVAPL